MEKKIAVVSGANRGLGLGTSLSLAEKNYHVVMLARKIDGMEQHIQNIKNKGQSAEVFKLDVTDEAAIRNLKKYLEDTYGHIDVLVNNAGVYLESGKVPSSVLEVPAEICLKTFEINSLGPLRLTQALVPLLAKSKSARIVNVSSGMGSMSEMGAGFAAYRMSKSALNALTRVFAAELADKKIKVNAICPGWVRTDMGGPSAQRSIEEGVSGIVWAATLPDSGPSGGYFRDGKKVEW
jgi:NAD(P)-dependent dehydrogenase (short-subunit alcohol dehydrogenase family)